MIRLFIHIAFFASIAAQIPAQSLYNNGSTISIQQNTVFSVGDSVINNGEISNDGTLLIGGAWINNETYNAGEGEISMSSPEPQVLNHNSQSFSRLKIEGGGEKLVQADLIVENELNLTDGILRTVNGSRIILEEGAEIIGGSSDSYIIGALYHRGTGYRYYPVGRDNRFLPVELLDIRGANPVIGIEVSEPLEGYRTNNNISVSGNHYWLVDLLSGSFLGSPVSLKIRNEVVIRDMRSAIVLEADTLSTTFRNRGQASFEGNPADGLIVSEFDINQRVLAIGSLPNNPETQPPAIIVYNAISRNQDGRHDFLKIENISYYPNNTVTIYNRWGDRIFRIAGYDNAERVFAGFANENGSGELHEGTYFYTVDLGNGSRPQNGFIVLRN